MEPNLLARMSRAQRLTLEVLTQLSWLTIREEEGHVVVECGQYDGASTSAVLTPDGALVPR